MPTDNKYHVSWFSITSTLALSHRRPHLKGQRQGTNAAAQVSQRETAANHALTTPRSRSSLFSFPKISGNRSLIGTTVVRSSAPTSRSTRSIFLTLKPTLYWCRALSRTVARSLDWQLSRSRRTLSNNVMLSAQNVFMRCPQIVPSAFSEPVSKCF